MCNEMWLSLNDIVGDSQSLFFIYIILISQTDHRYSEVCEVWLTWHIFPLIKSRRDECAHQEKWKVPRKKKNCFSFISILPTIITDDMMTERERREHVSARRWCLNQRSLTLEISWEPRNLELTMLLWWNLGKNWRKTFLTAHTRVMKRKWSFFFLFSRKIHSS